MKKVGKRAAFQAGRGFGQEVKDFLEMCQKLRRGRTFIRTGVYRFRTHEEANAWELKMMLGEKPPDHQQ